MIPKECLPALRWRPTLHHVFGDGRLGDLEAQHQQLAMDPGCSPIRILLAYPSDEVTQTPIDLWPSCPLSRFPAPERLETPHDASEEWSPAEPPAWHRAGSAKAGSYRPAIFGKDRTSPSRRSPSIC